MKETYILCPGPSLSRFDFASIPSTATTIAVNQAIGLHAANWWCFGDENTWTNCTPKSPEVRVFLLEEALRRLNEATNSDDYVCPPYCYIKWEDMEEEFHDLPYGWKVYSKLAAFVFATFLNRTLGDRGEKRIYLVGDDMTIDPNNPSRSAQRWEAERTLTKDIMEWAAQKGMEIIRL